MASSSQTSPYIALASVALSLAAVTAITSKQDGTLLNAARQQQNEKTSQKPTDDSDPSAASDIQHAAEVDAQHETATAISQIAKLSHTLRALGANGEDVTEVQSELSILTADLCHLQQDLIIHPDTVTSKDGFQNSFRSGMDAVMGTVSNMNAAILEEDESLSKTLSDAKQQLHEQRTILESLIKNTTDSVQLPPTPPSDAVINLTEKLKRGETTDRSPPRIVIDTSVQPSASHSKPSTSHLAPTADIPQEIFTPIAAQVVEMPPLETAESIAEEDEAGNLRSSDTLYAAVTENDHDSLTHLLSLRLDPSAQYGELQRTALHQAAHLNHISCLQTLLSHGADISAQDAKGDTPLHLAAWAGHSSPITHLLSHGADIDWLSGRDGYSPLWCAVSAHKPKIAKLLLRHGAQINLRASSGSGLMPLHQAAVTAQPSMCELLLDRGADPNSLDDDLCTPLHYASASGSTSCVKVLLNHHKGGADINAAQIHGLTAVHWAAHKGHVDVLEVLLENGAELNPKAKDGGTTPLHLAACGGHVGIACVLIERGSKKRNRDVGKWAGITGTPGEMAREKGFEELARILEM